MATSTNIRDAHRRGSRSLVGGRPGSHGRDRSPGDLESHGSRSGSTAGRPCAARARRARNVLRQRTLVEPPKPSVEVKLAEPTEVAWAEATADAEQRFSGRRRSTAAPAGIGLVRRRQAGKRVYAVFRPESRRCRQTAAAITLQLALVRRRPAHFRALPRCPCRRRPRRPRRSPERFTPCWRRRANSARPKLCRVAGRTTTGPIGDGERLRGRCWPLDAEIARLEKETPTTPIMRELPETKRRVTHIMVKGNFRQPGDAVAAGRAGRVSSLARRDACATGWVWPAGWSMRDNPLTARVAVNRFGRSCSASGWWPPKKILARRGCRPRIPSCSTGWPSSFMESGWNMKAILRQIVCSATYRQSSTAAADALEKDPGNRCWPAARAIGSKPRWSATRRWRSAVC